MTELVFHKDTPMPCPADELFSWHETPDAFHKLMPPGEMVKVLHHDGKITNGARAVLLVGVWPVRQQGGVRMLPKLVAGVKDC